MRHALAVLALVTFATVHGAWAGTVFAGEAGHGAASRPTIRPEVPVTAVEETLEQANNSPMLLADPTEPRFVVMASRLDNPDFGCALHVSGDGGRGWQQAIPVPALPPGAEKCYAPEVAFDGRGVLYYLFVGLQGRGNSPMGAFLVTSSDRARTFDAPRRVLGPHRYMVRMAMDTALGDDGRLHLAWVEARSEPPTGGFGPPPNPVMAAFSDDGGRTLSVPVQVNDPGRVRVVAPALAVGADHAVHVLYYDLIDDARDYRGLDGPPWEGNWSLVLSTSRDRGRTFPAGVPVDEDLVPPERVMLVFTMPAAGLAADRTGRVYVAWHDGRNGDWDVFLRRSDDSGRTFGGVRRVNDDGVRNRRHQYLPRVALSPAGRLDVVFYDRRRDPENLRNDVYLASSTSAGERFAPNVRLTTENSSSQTGPRYQVASAAGLVESGSRLGLLSAEAVAVAAWPDTRNADVDGAQQDIFATEVLLADSDGNAGRPTVGTAAATAMAVALVLVTAVGVGARRWRASRRVNASAGTPSSSP